MSMSPIQTRNEMKEKASPALGIDDDDCGRTQRVRYGKLQFDVDVNEYCNHAIHERRPRYISA